MNIEHEIEKIKPSNKPKTVKSIIISNTDKTTDTKVIRSYIFPRRLVNRSKYSKAVVS